MAEPAAQATIDRLASRVRDLEAALDTERLARAAAEARVKAEAARRTPEEEDWDALEAAAASFKAGRDRAVARLDAAHAEADRATAEVSNLAAALAEATDRAAKWEAAAADAVARADRLADLLEESASGGGGGDSSGDLEAALSTERARTARLEATVAALCVEAGRASGLTAAVSAAVLPALAEVEDRLAALRIPTRAGG